MTFTGEEMSLDIPESGVSLESGWNIKSLNFKVTMCRVMYIYFYFYVDTITSKFLKFFDFVAHFHIPSISLLTQKNFSSKKKELTVSNSAADTFLLVASNYNILERNYSLPHSHRKYKSQESMFLISRLVYHHPKVSGELV